MLGKEREVHALAVPGGAERRGLPGPHAEALLRQRRPFASFAVASRIFSQRAAGFAQETSRRKRRRWSASSLPESPRRATRATASTSAAAVRGSKRTPVDRRTGEPAGFRGS